MIKMCNRILRLHSGVTVTDKYVLGNIQKLVSLDDGDKVLYKYRIVLQYPVTYAYLIA